VSGEVEGVWVWGVCAGGVASGLGDDGEGAVLIEECGEVAEFRAAAEIDFASDGGECEAWSDGLGDLSCGDGCVE
jgi:hypothetical protein